MDPVSRSKKKKILIVDDESPIAELIADICNQFGFETKVLVSGENVMDVAKSYGPDLLTLDLLMPDKSGLEILAELKEDEKTKLIPVIIISAIAGSVSFEGIIEQSQGILSKPFQVPRLKQVIETALSHSHN